jgi:hypothetical protein
MKRAAFVGATSLPVRVKVLLDRFRSAKLVSPFRICILVLKEFTYPVIRKKSATAIRPPTMSRRKGYWKRETEPFPSIAGELSQFAKHEQR